MSWRPVLLTALGLALALPAQGDTIAGEDPTQAADVAAYNAWFADYRVGAFRLVKNDSTDDAALAHIDALMAKIAQWNTLDAAKLLFLAASVDPRPGTTGSSTELIDFYRELQPWKVRGLAARHLRGMDGDGILTWLLNMLSTPGIRAAKQNQDQLDAAAVLRVLAGHKSLEARAELLRACHTMPTELRVRAVNAMAADATIELVPTLIELLRDSEPNVRIAACNAIGTAMQPHVDETLGLQPTAETLAVRDQAIAALAKVAERDRVWQARSAAAFGLAIMRCKPVIPALIGALDKELGRTKDPWAMDVRLHKLLEGLTGQSVVRGSIKPWREFWKREGASFRVAKAAKPGEERAKSNRYEKFFDLEIESDRVLFVIDFSGSMVEPITLQQTATGAPAGKELTKAQLVVQELKKMIMSFPDGAMLNIIVFSDDIRIWRSEAGRPTLVKIDDDARDDLLGSFLDGLRPAGPTNLHDALALALDFGGRGLFDKYYAAAFDTLYVISDGAPSAGPVIDKEEIRRLVREANNLRKITINCITMGQQNDTEFLREMAEENGGRHIHIE
ncbi:MAG: HEAT repeat domain-containing protein [Planctomycetes bacterium]|nr:HEAT repeat domain-containing protein [Planctomycetota bacterium]